MDDHRKLYRLFQLIARLRSPLGCDKQEMARDFNVSERTIERYLVLLHDLGFEIIKNDRRFKIESVEKRVLRHEELIGFSLEEAAIIRNALLASDLKQPLQKSVIDKIYALTDLDELAETIYNQNVSKNIIKIREAIKNKVQLHLKSYQSISSNTSQDYLVEPIRFYNYYRYLVAFDVKAQMVKQFKTERITTATVTDKTWQCEADHKQLEVDVFGMGGDAEIALKLKLSKRAYHLLIEEYPDTNQNIKKQGSAVCYTDKVRSLKGVGRFVMGLLDEIEVIEPQELKDYIKEKINNF